MKNSYPTSSLGYRRLIYSRIFVFWAPLLFVSGGQPFNFCFGTASQVASITLAVYGDPTSISGQSSMIAVLMSCPVGERYERDSMLVVVVGQGYNPKDTT